MTGKESVEAFIEPLFARISEVSSLPDVALQIIEVANDATTEAEDMLMAVRGDPALAMRLMRAVNSSYYGVQNRVADLKQAVALLGFTEIRNLALTADVAPLFQESVGHNDYSRRGLWNHMVASGMVARLIAQTCGKAPPREAYLAGLLHDLGLILIDQYVHAPFCRVIDALSEETPICRIESQILGFDHTDLGQYVATRWNLPDLLTAVIAYHHAPDQYEGEHRDMVCVVALANFLCHSRGISSLGVCNRPTLPEGLFAQIELKKPQLLHIMAQLDEVLAAADEMALAHVR